ncbi:MAG: pilus assembly protein PilM [Deltaproteobacteria bacterium]|nr:pilus assembly protein PilM [Deltaproteobacteria bacterium]
MKSLFGPSEIAGIELTRKEVRAVTLSVTVRGFQVTGLYRIPFDSDASVAFPDRVASALEVLSRSWASAPEWIASALDGHQVVARRLSIPNVKLEAGSPLIKFEMEPHLSFEVEDALVTFLPRELKGARKEVVAFAARKHELKAHLELLAKASMEPRCVGAGNLGAYLCYRVCGSVPEDDADKTIALMNLDGGEMHLTVFDGRGPLLVRSVDLGISDERPDAEERDLNPEDTPPEGRSVSKSFGDPHRMAREITRELELSCFQLKLRPNEVILTGQGSARSGLQEALSASLDVPCRVWDPLEALPSRLDPQGARDGLAFASVLGITLSALGPEGKRPDFLVEEFTFKRPLAQIRGKLIYLASVAALILIVTATGFFYRLQDREQELRSIKQDIRRVYTDTFPDSKVIVNELEQMRTAIQSTRESLSTLGFRKGRVRTLDLLAALSERIPKDSGVRMIDLVVDPEMVRLSGEAGTFEAVDALKDRLSGVPGAAEVKVEEANLSSFEKKIEFSISIHRQR